MAPSGESFRNTFFFLRTVQSFSHGNLQNTTNNVTGAQEDHDRSRYAAYSVKIVFCFSSFQKIETIRPHVCVYTLQSDEVVSLISGDDSVVGSPMQWMLHYMCYKTVDFYHLWSGSPY